MKRIGKYLLFIQFLLAACKPLFPSADLDRQIAAAVAATVAAIPTSTPYPTPSPYPTPTPINLNGLFCGYGFCIGQPEYINPFDLNAVDDRISSNYASGKLVGYTNDLLLLVVWQAGVTDLQYMLEVVSQASGGSLTAKADILLIGPYNLFYQPVQPPPDSTLPFGGAAAWQCGSRAFAWLAYTTQEGSAPGLLDTAMSKFTCGE